MQPHKPHFALFLAFTLLALPVAAQAQMTLQPDPHQFQMVPASASGEELIASVENPPLVVVVDIATGRRIKTIEESAWQPSGAGRPVALDREGHLYTLDVATTTVWVYDRKYRLQRSFAVDLSCVGSPGGSGLRDLAFTSRGTMVALGGWQDGSINYLLEIDPETGATVHCCNLNSVTGTNFEGARIAVDAAGLVYVTQYAPTAGPKAVAAIELATCTLVEMIPTPATNTNLLDVEVLPAGGLLVSDVYAGTLWLSDPQRQSWCSVTPCLGTLLAHSAFTVAHGFVYGANTSGCSDGAGTVDVVPLGCGQTSVKTLDLELPRIDMMVFRHR